MLMQTSESAAMQKWRKPRIAAYDRKDRKKIIAIGTNAVKVAEKARKSGKNFIMGWVGIPGKKYVFQCPLSSAG